jgi:6-phosphogluconolactonase
VKSTRGELEVLRDPRELAQRVARWMTDLARAKKGDFAVALSGGSTPRLLYQTLAGNDFVKIFPWDRVHWFWGDERFVRHQDPLSNYQMTWTAMLSLAPVSAAHIHAVPIEGLTPDQAASEYEKKLKSFYGADRLDPARPMFDLVLLGLGTDGHTASLFPGSAALDERRHWATAVDTQSPARITLTYPVLESSAYAAFLVTGAEKRDALRGLVRGEPDLPASHLHPIGELRLFADTAAAG